jgi:hypothetical protein
MLDRLFGFMLSRNVVSSGDALGVFECGDELIQLSIAHIDFLTPDIPPTACSRLLA